MNQRESLSDSEGVTTMADKALGAIAVHDVSASLNALLADMFAPYVKTKNFHWHVSAPHFRDYHLLLEDQATQIFAATDAMSGRVRKLGGTTLRSIGRIARRQRVTDNDASCAPPQDMLVELREDKAQAHRAHARYAHKLMRDHAAAEELVQECLVRGVSKQRLWREGSNLRFWLCTILHNLYVNEIRRTVREGIAVELSEVDEQLASRRSRTIPCSGAMPAAPSPS
jgi:starvation-inducible DNA-binding protein